MQAFDGVCIVYGSWQRQTGAMWCCQQSGRAVRTSLWLGYRSPVTVVIISTALLQRAVSDRETFRLHPSVSKRTIRTACGQYIGPKTVRTRDTLALVPKCPAAATYDDLLATVNGR